jgi:hypothetical protein
MTPIAQELAKQWRTQRQIMRDATLNSKLPEAAGAE